MTPKKSSLVSIHHYGVAAESIEDVVHWLEQHSVVSRVSQPVWDDQQKAWLSLVEVEGGVLEIVSGPVVQGFLDRGRPGYHVCFEVTDIDQSVAELIASGAHQVTRPSPAVLFGGRRVCFLATPIGLVELLEKDNHGLAV
jgi:methylmalonyl-CoA/ethylmalonyl-CoA epimerase